MLIMTNLQKSNYFLFRGMMKQNRQLFCMYPYYVSTVSSNRAKHNIQYKPYQAAIDPDHDHKNMALKRPMSPHMMVYAPTISAMASIAQRITGTIVAFSALLMSLGTLFLSNGVETYVSIIQSMNFGGFTIFLLKLIIGFPFAYHYCNGIRYSYFFMAKLTDLKDVESSAKKAAIASIVFTFLFALF